jgi:hypothetical protein
MTNPHILPDMGGLLDGVARSMVLSIKGWIA